LLTECASHGASIPLEGRLRSMRQPLPQWYWTVRMWWRGKAQWRDSNSRWRESGADLRFAPVSVTFSNPDEGAPGSSPLGTGDRRLTLHRRQASSRRDELIIAQDEVLGMRTNRFPPPRRVRNESPQAVILVHALAPDQGSREYQNAVFTTPKTCQKRAFLAQKQH
jgi:hypothetical protein